MIVPKLLETMYYAPDKKWYVYLPEGRCKTCGHDPGYMHRLQLAGCDKGFDTEEEAYDWIRSLP